MKVSVGNGTLKKNSARLASYENEGVSSRKYGDNSIFVEEMREITKITESVARVPSSAKAYANEKNIISVGKADLETLRRKLGVPETETVAVGKTDVKGLQDRVFEGQSPTVRKEAGLEDLDVLWPNRAFKAPRSNSLFIKHAEEDVANAFDRAISEMNIMPEEVIGVLKIHQSNPTGVCKACIQGLSNDKVKPGVLKQLSLKYPYLRIEVSSEVVAGVKVNGRSNFIIMNGSYLE